MHLPKRSSLIYPVLTGLWALLIFRLSTMNGAQLPKINWLASPDKFGHAFVYGVLMIGLCLSLQSNRIATRRNIVLAFIATALYGIALEIVQYLFYPGRYFEYWDIVANISGALLAWLVAKRILLKTSLGKTT